MPTALKRILSSKRVQAAVVTIAAVAFEGYLPIDETQLAMIVGVVLAFILGDSVRPVVPPATPSDRS